MGIKNRTIVVCEINREDTCGDVKMDEDIKEIMLLELGVK
jgi:hypothetical protein